jgi:transcriptional regulator with XRE-family HTH domain
VCELLDPIVVGRVVQEYREDRGISQEVLSGLADIGRTHLSAIERGVRRPTLETFFRIAEALRVKPSLMMAEIEKRMKDIQKDMKE